MDKKQEMDLILAIVKRAQEMGITLGDQCTQVMDMHFTHQQFNLRLEEMLAAPEFDFIHDFCGIQRHIDRKTGAMGGLFIPRYAGHVQKGEGV